MSSDHNAAHNDLVALDFGGHLVPGSDYPYMFTSGTALWKCARSDRLQPYPLSTHYPAVQGGHNGTRGADLSTKSKDGALGRGYALPLSPQGVTNQRPRSFWRPPLHFQHD